jgi:hypothetical protein
LVFGGDALTLHADMKTPLAEGEYRVLANGAILEARIKREKYYPQWSIDYVSQSGKQVVDATITRDDTGGPAVVGGACSFTPGTAKNGELPVTLAVKGEFFSNSMTPSIAVAGKPLAATSFTQQFISAKEWDFTATVPSGTSKLTVSFTPTTKNLIREIVCSAPSAKKVQKAKGGVKPTQTAKVGTTSAAKQ